MPLSRADRRQFFLALALLLSGETSLKGEKGQLTVDLNQWSTVIITRKNKRKTITVDQLFEEL